MTQFTKSERWIKLNAYLKITTSLDRGKTKFNLLDIFNEYDSLNVFKRFLYEMVKDDRVPTQLLLKIAQKYKLDGEKNVKKIICNLPENVLRKSATFLSYAELLNCAMCSKVWFNTFYNDNSIDCVNVIDVCLHHMPVNPQKIKSLLFCPKFKMQEFGWGEISSQLPIKIIYSFIRQCTNADTIVIDPWIYDLVGNNINNQIINPEKIKNIETFKFEYPPSNEAIVSCCELVKKCYKLKQGKFLISVREPIYGLKTIITTNFDMLLLYKQVQDYEGPLMYGIKQFSGIKDHSLYKLHFKDINLLEHMISFPYNIDIIHLNTIIKQSLSQLLYLKLESQIKSYEQSKIISQIIHLSKLKEFYFYLFLKNDQISDINKVLEYYLPVFKAIGTQEIEYLCIKVGGIAEFVHKLLIICLPVLGCGSFKVKRINIFDVVSFISKLDNFSSFIGIIGGLLNRIIMSEYVKNILWIENNLSMNNFCYILKTLKIKENVNSNLGLKLHIIDECNNKYWLDTFMNCLFVLQELQIKLKINLKLSLICYKKHTWNQNTEINEKLENVKFDGIFYVVHTNTSHDIHYKV